MRIHGQPQHTDGKLVPNENLSHKTATTDSVVVAEEELNSNFPTFSIGCSSSVVLNVLNAAAL